MRVVAASLFTLLVSFASVAAQNSSTTCSSIENNVDYPGNDIADVAQAIAADCCTTCAQTTNCKAFVWSSGVCHLKSIAVGRTTLDPSIGAVAGLMPTPPPSPTPSVCASTENNVDYPGNDLQDVSRADPNECCSVCASVNNCRAFVWSAGVCHLKSAAVGRIPIDPSFGAVAGFLPPSPPSPTPSTCASTENNVDYPGNDLQDVSRADPKDCCSDCANINNCRAFVWSAGVCHLKSAALGRIPIDPSFGAVAGVMPPPANSTCASTEKNVDFPGNDIKDVTQANPLLCCDECSQVPGCAAFVWSAGVCHLKTAATGRTPLDPAIGAVAGIMPTPPAPLPPTCSSLIPNVDYAGYDLASEASKTPEGCCDICSQYTDCKVFVWSNNVCYLKVSTLGGQVPASGAVAGIRAADNSPPLPPSNSSQLKAQIYQPLPNLPKVQFNYIPNANWFNNNPSQLTEMMSMLESLPAERPDSDTSPDPVFSVEGGFQFVMFSFVNSTGECASLVSGFGYKFFTYGASNLYCLGHDFSGTTTTSLMVPNLKPIVARLDMSSAQIGTDQTANTDSLCQKACSLKFTCAAYALINQACVLYGPAPISGQDFAGWIVQPLNFQDDSATPYTYLQDASLTGVSTKSLSNIASLDACADAASKASLVLFQYTASTKICLLLTPQATTSTKSISLINYLPTPMQIGSSAFPASVNQVNKSTAGSAVQCASQCIPSQTNCFATSYDSQTSQCITHSAAFTVGSQLGWLTTAYLPARPTKVNKVAFFTTAHQDDHELFFSPAVYDALKDANTKAVFTYISAGDAGLTDNWYQARELGTLAATEAWIKAFGLFHIARTTETVTLNGHKVTKVTMGNSVHYFFRLSEAGMTTLISDQPTPAAPIDQPLAFYNSYTDLRSTIVALFKDEAKGVPVVTTASLEYESNLAGDHVLHMGTGKLVAAAVASDAQLNACVVQSYYFGYQLWMSTVNIVEPYLSFQRHIWAKLSHAVRQKYPSRFIWSDHSTALGRTYMNRQVPSSGTLPACKI